MAVPSRVTTMKLKMPLISGLSAVFRLPVKISPVAIIPKCLFLTLFHPPPMSLSVIFASYNWFSPLISGLSALFRLSVKISPATIIPKCFFWPYFTPTCRYQWFSPLVIVMPVQYPAEFICGICFLHQNFKQLKLPLYANFQPKRRWPLFGINFWKVSGHPSSEGMISLSVEPGVKNRFAAGLGNVVGQNIMVLERAHLRRDLIGNPTRQSFYFFPIANEIAVHT